MGSRASIIAFTMRGKKTPLHAFKDLLCISEKENLGILFGQSVQIDLIDPIKPYTINE